MPFPRQFGTFGRGTAVVGATAESLKPEFRYPLTRLDAAMQAPTTSPPNIAKITPTGC